jgi:hypothetical protein
MPPVTPQTYTTIPNYYTTTTSSSTAGYGDDPRFQALADQVSKYLGDFQRELGKMWTEIQMLRQQVMEMENLHRGPPGLTGRPGERGAVGISGVPGNETPEFKELEEKIADALDRVQELAEAVEDLEQQ